MLISAIGVGLQACSTMPCVNSGAGYLAIPESRVPAIDEIQSEGVCDVYSPTEGCDSGQCRDSLDGGPSQVFMVVGHAHGNCTVTVTFSDGADPQVEQYRFGGPINNCCNEICAIGAG